MLVPLCGRGEGGTIMEQFWKDEHFSVRWKEIPESARWRGEWKDFCRLPRNATLRYLLGYWQKLWMRISSGGVLFPDPVDKLDPFDHVHEQS